MRSEPHDSASVTLSGEYLDRLRQALHMVAAQARLAQSAGYGRNIDDLLADIEELARGQLARIDIALDDDQAEAEDSGIAEVQRRSSYPLYRTA
ncbi:MAG TPA: hypothetical protein VHT74_23255 [Acetobacteraceae bacterium]|jgi:hypothetical protein|nr:hypothetical protein [Acetobacteraceae bacterium]